MEPLNFPQYAFSFRKSAGKIHILDSVRKKYVVLQPEEWVRQHVLKYLTEDLKYPKALIKVESGLSYNQLNKRSDVLVFNREGRHHLLVECKSFKKKLDQSALDQATVYNKKLGAQYVLVTNGINHYCCELHDNQYRFISEVPCYL